MHFGKRRARGFGCAVLLSHHHIVLSFLVTNIQEATVASKPRRLRANLLLATGSLPTQLFLAGRQAGGQVLPTSHIATCLDRASAPPPGCRYGAAARNFQLGFSFDAFVRAAVEAGWEQRTCCPGAPSGFRLKRENYEHNRSVHTHRHNGAGRLWGVRCLGRPSIRPQVLPHNHIPNQHIHNQRHNLRLSPPWPGR